MGMTAAEKNAIIAMLTPILDIDGIELVDIENASTDSTTPHPQTGWALGGGLSISKPNRIPGFRMSMSIYQVIHSWKSLHLG